MTSRILFLSLSFFLRIAVVIAQPTQYLEVHDFSNHKSMISLDEKSPGTVVLFINANKCIGCVKELCAEINTAVQQGYQGRICVLIRVGNSSLMRRESMDMLTLNAKSMERTQVFFDVENDSTAGVEAPGQVKGNFGRLKIFQTPAVLLTWKKKNSSFIATRISSDQIMPPK